MAYQITSRTVVIEFEEEALSGAQVKCKLDVPLGLFLQIQEALVGERIEEAFRTFADEIVVGWEFEDADGKPIPVSYEGFSMLPFRVAVATVTSWISGVNSAPLS
jgi:hypothetical protein